MASISQAQLNFLMGVTEFYRARTDTKMTIAAERLAVIAAITLPITATSSVVGMNVIVNDADPLDPARRSCWRSWPRVDPAAALGQAPGLVVTVVRDCYCGDQPKLESHDRPLRTWLVDAAKPQVVEDLLSAEEGIGGLLNLLRERPAFDGERAFSAGQLDRSPHEGVRDPLASVPGPDEEARQKPDTLVLFAGPDLPMTLLRPLVATTYRDRGPQAHQPTGSPATEARIPIGVGSTMAMASKRRRLPLPNQPAANCPRVTQNAMHQQRRVAPGCRTVSPDRPGLPAPRAGCRPLRPRTEATATPRKAGCEESRGHYQRCAAEPTAPGLSALGEMGADVPQRAVLEPDVVHGAFDAGKSTERAPERPRNQVLDELRLPVVVDPKRRQDICRDVVLALHVERTRLELSVQCVLTIRTAQVSEKKAAARRSTRCTSERNFPIDG